MAMGQPAQTDKGWIRELGRRRVFVFVAAFLVLALANAVREENDIFLHALDDNVIILLALIILVYVGISWKKDTPEALRKQHNIVMLLLVVAVAFQIYGFVQEINDPADFGNEIPSLMLLVLALVNRFV